MKLLLEKTFGVGQLDELANSLKIIIQLRKKLMFKGDVGAGKQTFIQALAKQVRLLC